MKVFLKKLLAFVIIVMGLQLIIGHKIPAEVEVLDKAISEKTDVIFFCDSTNFAYSKQDNDKRTISQMLQGMIPERKILTIDHGAFGMDMYLAFCKYICRANNRPNVVIIPVNMRSFSPGWDQRPDWQFEQERFFLEHPLIRSFYKPLAVFKVISTNEISVEQYNKTSVYCGDKVIGTVREFDFRSDDPNSITDEKIRKKFIFNYMYPLTPDHRKLQSMMQVVNVLNSIDVKVVFYITPLDIEEGRKYLSDVFNDRVRANVELVKALLREQNIEPLDLSQNLPSEHFSWTVYPNEHLDQAGRLYVANHLAEALRNNTIR
jgi:hypothetical protein